MNNLSALSKLVIVLLVVAMLTTLGNCAMRSARRNVRVRRIDQVEEMFEN